MPEQRDLYKVLQVDPEAEVDVIQAAYRRLAQRHHPDLAGGEEASGRMIALNAAWEVLRDPGRRAAYDLERARQQARAAAAGAGATPGSGQAAAAAGPHRNPATGVRRGGGDEGWPIAGEAAAPGSRPGEPASSDWTSGRSTSGGGYDPSTMGAPDGYGAAGRPPGNPSGSILSFGRYASWSLGEIARRDLEYLEWLERSPIGRQHRDEVDAILRRMGRRRTGGDDGDRRGLFRR